MAALRGTPSWCGQPRATTPLFNSLYMQRVLDGEEPLMAYFNAKHDFLGSIGSDEERKALHAAVFYGVPPYLRPVIEF